MVLSAFHSFTIIHAFPPSKQKNVTLGVHARVSGKVDVIDILEHTLTPSGINGQMFIDPKVT